MNLVVLRDFTIINSNLLKVIIMKSIKIVSLFLLILLVKSGFSQKISGKVYEEIKEESKKTQESLPGANVYWQNVQGGTVTDVDGNFEIDAPTNFPATLIISFVGYQTDSIVVKKLENSLKIKLKKDIQLAVFEIAEREKTSSVSLVSPIHVETLSSKELTKAACCNISESFETNASVDVNFTDAVSGTKKIQMLGLDRYYTQIQIENMPFVRGLSSAYGLTFVPGTWAQSIQIKKGAGSVINGYESITGQINIELQKPEESDRFFVNGYLNMFGRAELNVHAAQKLNSRWSNMQFVHVSNQSPQLDNNNDSFLDNPIKTQYNVLNRWKYSGKKHESQIGIRGVYEDLKAGQFKSTDVQNPFKINVETKQLELFSKNGFLFPKKPFKSIGVISTVRYHEHNSNYGLKKYNAIQKSGYLNTIYQTIIGNTDNTIRMGGSLVFDDFQNNFNDSLFSREELVPGVFTEYSLVKDKTSLVVGLRYDYHNLYGDYITPRVHYKYNLTELTALRFSLGRGYRTANPLIESASVMSSSRRVVLATNLKPEVAWNYGTSLTHKFTAFKKDMTIDFDYYFTDFENQVVVDIENPREVAFYNLIGKSYSHSFQAEYSVNLTKQIEFKTAYKFYEIKTDYKAGLRDKPLVPKHRVLANVAYFTNFDKWKFDATMQWFGVSRLPSTTSNLPENQLKNVSNAFITINTQVTRAFRKFEVYLGVENVTDFKQSSPIIASNQPFGSEFDASMIWGPINGRMVYTGFRYNIK